MHKEKKIDRKGFTMVELLIVIAIVAMFATTALPFTINFFQRQVAHEEAKIMVSILRQSQSKAMKESNESKWGIYLKSNSFILFKGSSYEQRDPVYDRKFNASIGVRFEPVDLPDPLEIVFEKGTGRPSISEIEIKVISREESQKININSQGKIEYEL